MNSVATNFAYPSGATAQYGQYPNSNANAGKVKKPKIVKVGGMDTYSLRGATLVEGYFPGAMRQNFRQDPLSMIGKVDFGTFGSDQNYNGPGTLVQSIPDGSRFQYKEILMAPRPTINKEVSIDDRQLASYQVEQLHTNPLSQYTTNPNGAIPGFDCNSEPNNFSTMVNRRTDDYKVYFENLKPNNWTGATQVPGRAAGSAVNVYPQYTGAQANPNEAIVYNMNMNTSDEVNPFIVTGGSNVATSQAEFSGKCYSGNFVPGQQIKTNSGSNAPIVYSANKKETKTVSEIGFMNPMANKSNTFCEADRAVRFANPLVLNSLN